MNDLPVGFAVVGAGAFADAHLAALAELPDARVCAVVDIDPERAKVAARRAGGVAWSTSLAEVLTRPEVQAVDLCTPNDTHAALGLAALRAGRHLLTEKPIALELADADRLDEAARAAGVHLGVGLVMRHFPAFRAVRSAVSAGDVGRPHTVDLSHQATMIWPGGWRSWQQRPDRSGGHLLHNGSHLVDLAGWFIGSEPIRVYGRGYRTHSAASDTDDHWSLSISYANGATAHCEYSYSMHGASNSVLEAIVAGTSGAVSYSSLDGIVVHDAAGADVPFDMRGTSMRRELAEFIRVVRGEPAPVSFGELRNTLATCLAGQRSIETGSPVDVERVAVKHV